MVGNFRTNKTYDNLLKLIINHLNCYYKICYVYKLDRIYNYKFLNIGDFNG